MAIESKLVPIVICNLLGEVIRQQFIDFFSIGLRYRQEFNLKKALSAAGDLSKQVFCKQCDRGIWGAISRVTPI